MASPTTTELRILKKRTESLVRALYEEAKARRVRDVRMPITATGAYAMPAGDTLLSVTVRNPGGGFSLRAAPADRSSWGSVLSWEKSIEAAKRLYPDEHPQEVRTRKDVPMELNVDGDASAILAALEAVEMDIAGTVAKVVARDAEQRARREAEKEQRKREAEQSTLDHAAAHPEGVAAIWAAAERITKMILVAAQLEDASRIYHRAGSRNARPILVADETDGIAVLYPDKIYLARTVRQKFGLSIEGIKAKLWRGEQDMASGDLALLCAVLERHQSNPFAAAGRVGLCCFCALPLTDPTSRHHGYGPECAAHMHLPWGPEK
jgi:hypothetical protein